MKTARTIVTTLLLVAAMLIGAIVAPATFAASEPYDGEVYASTATYNAPLPETVESLTIVDSSVSDADRFSARNIINDITSESSWGAWNFYNEYILHEEEDVVKILSIIKDTSGFKGMLEYIHVPDDYDILLAINEQFLFISFEWKQVAVHTDGNTIVYTLPVDDMWDIMDIYQRSQGVDIDSKQPIITDDLVGGMGIYDSEWSYVDISAEQIQHIAMLVNNNYSYVRMSDVQVPTYFDFVIVDNNLCCDVYVLYAANEILVADYSHVSYYVITLEQEVMDEIMRIYRTSTALSVELTDSIVGNLVFMAETKGFGVGVLSYEDICNVVYETGNYYQSAMEIASALSVGCMTGEQAIYYTGLAMRAQTWEEMRENLICAIERYAATTVQYTKDFGNNSFAANMVLESFRSHWYELDTMDVVHYALWMSVVAGGCY